MSAGGSVITVGEADALAQKAHGTSRTKTGSLFIEHVRRVASRFEADPDPYAVPAALLHDAVEKGTLRWVDLRAAGADDRLVALVEVLTERAEEAEHDYLARCASDPLALQIKRADIGDKLEAPPAAVDDQLREESRHRLALLEELAARR
jgi:(p)ppGpp synthase/HD superfamily hydrolase